MLRPASGIVTPRPSATLGKKPMAANSPVPMAKTPIASASSANRACLNATLRAVTCAMRTILMCLEFFDEDESLRLLQCNMHWTRKMIRVKLRRQKTEIPGNPMRAVEDMETFVVVAREGSFAAAARRLGVSTSVVADAIARLERRLDVRLTLRTKRRQTLTDAWRRSSSSPARAASRLRRGGWVSRPRLWRTRSHGWSGGLTSG